MTLELRNTGNTSVYIGLILLLNAIILVCHLNVKNYFLKNANNAIFGKAVYFTQLGNLEWTKGTKQSKVIKQR